MIFLTGGTGFLGRELLARLLAEGERVSLLVRPEGRADSEKRVRKLLAALVGAERAKGLFSQLEVVSGDITMPCFGLGESQFSDLARRIGTIYHSAASTSLGQNLEDARKINVGGTLQVLALAERARSLHNHNVRLCHVSTAYVAGDRDTIVSSEELSLTQRFRNTYEQTKAEAERLVRDRAAILPVLIMRPSLIVGDSHTGKTSAFNVIYVPARFLAQGLFCMLPARPNIPCDLVPINYVADAVIALSKQALPSGSCFHLCSGVGRETNPREILEMIVHAVNAYRKRGKALFLAPPMIPLEIISRAHASITAAKSSVIHFEKMIMKRLGLLGQLLPLFPYMDRNPRFDVTQTTQMLNGILHQPPLFHEYAERVFRYCLDTNWGRKLQADMV